MTLQKNVKSHVFLDFEKNRRNVFSNSDTERVNNPADMLFIRAHAHVSAGRAHRQGRR